ncbi:unnamed protein product [Ilex paraguariensis]|uniref:Uncharacterized protein n=1 Tax=Ilex paraguariensis TaxID=185542 RepID=A0ABC8SW03_9AQUA
MVLRGYGSHRGGWLTWMVIVGGFNWVLIDGILGLRMGLVCLRCWGGPSCSGDGADDSSEKIGDSSSGYYLRSICVSLRVPLFTLFDWKAAQIRSSISQSRPSISSVLERLKVWKELHRMSIDSPGKGES